MRTLTGGYNAFDGAIGVYWPESTAAKRYILGVNLENEADFLQEIYEDILSALSNRLQSRFCSWNYLQELANRKLIDRLKAEDSRSIGEYVEAFDAENKALKAQLGEQDAEIRSLQRKILTLSSVQRGAVSGGILKRGTEVDLYPNEILSVAVAALIEFRRRIDANSRLDHVVSDLLKANPMPTEPDERRRLVQNALKAAGGSGGVAVDQLEEIGFDTVSEKKHTKIVFSGDNRYTFTLPKTPSDGRSGKNIASDICSCLFPRGGAE